jgi:hypothetical protein
MNKLQLATPTTDNAWTPQFVADETNLDVSGCDGAPQPLALPGRLGVLGGSRDIDSTASEQPRPVRLRWRSVPAGSGYGTIVTPGGDVSQVEQASRAAERLLATLERRRRHVRGVAATATVLAEGLPDGGADTLVAAAWLHDIGYSPELVDTGFHPMNGARWLAAEGFSREVTALVAHHTGARFEAEERGLLSDWAELPVPRTDLLALLTAADISTSPDGEPVRARDRIEEILDRYREGDPVHRAITRSGPALIRATESVLADRGLSVEQLVVARQG